MGIKLDSQFNSIGKLSKLSCIKSRAFGSLYSFACFIICMDRTIDVELMKKNSSDASETYSNHPKLCFVAKVVCLSKNAFQNNKKGINYRIDRFLVVSGT